MEKDPIKDCLEELANSLETNEIFLSEDDFKYNLAKVLELHDKFKNVILEFPIDKKDLYNDKKAQNIEDNLYSYIDVYCETDETAYFIELKYKTVKLEKVIRHGKSLKLKNHNCHTQNRFRVYKDIERIECCLDWYKNKINEKPCVGYVVFLTNYDNYKSSNRKVTYPLNKEETVCYADENLYINNKYKINWIGEFETFKTLETNEENKEFHCALIKIK